MHRKHRPRLRMTVYRYSSMPDKLAAGGSTHPDPTRPDAEPRGPQPGSGFLVSVVGEMIRGVWVAK